MFSSSHDNNISIRANIVTPFDLVIFQNNVDLDEDVGKLNGGDCIPLDCVDLIGMDLYKCALCGHVICLK